MDDLIIDIYVLVIEQWKSDSRKLFRCMTGKATYTPNTFPVKDARSCLTYLNDPSLDKDSIVWSMRKWWNHEQVNYFGRAIPDNEFEQMLEDFIRKYWKEHPRKRRKQQ